MRAILVLHRYLGVAVGLLMTMWCLSGVVMMYVAYPEIDAAERLRGLAPLDLRQCCNADALGSDRELAGFRIEMVGDTPVLRLEPSGAGFPGNADLPTGAAMATLDATRAAKVAHGYGSRVGIRGAPRMAERITRDQWTVQHFRRHQPLYRIPFDDDAGTVLYVAGSTGEVVQHTTRRERFWNWLGAVPHWLYPTVLRQNGALWSQVVIGAALLGCFLTLTGLYVGLARLRRRRSGSISPYRGLWAWHHMLGLAAGLMTLSWVASGLLSITPWGLLESEASAVQRQRLSGTVLASDFRRFLSVAPTTAFPPNIVRIESAPLAGRLFVVATTSEGRAFRFDRDGRPAPLGEATLRAALDEVGSRVARFEPLAGEDDYYYRHKGAPKPPVYRAILADGQGTRLYIDRLTGTLQDAVDRPARQYRWLHHGLHSLDFAALRPRYRWDGVMLLLLAAVTLVCGTGCWMGVRRVRTDVVRWRKRQSRMLTTSTLIRILSSGESRQGD